MSVFVTLPLSTTFSQFVIGMDGQYDAIRSQERGNTEPGVKVPGLPWQSTDATTLTALSSTQPGGTWTEGMLLWDGANWRAFADTRYIALNDHGTVKWLADQAANNHKITGLAAGSAAGHSVRYEQAILVSGVNAFGADQSMGGHKLTNLGAPAGANDAARLVDLNGVPPYPCWAYWQTNRDALGNGLPVIVQQNADQVNTYTECGYVPRELTVRLWGTFRNQADGSAVGGILQGYQFTIRRYNADAVGGDPGTWDDNLVANIDLGGGLSINVYVKWKYAPGALGFYLRFRLKIGGGGETAWCDLAKTGDMGTDGTIQIQARFGVGT